MTQFHSFTLRRPGAFLLAGAAIALTALMACTTSSGGGGEPTAYTCKDANDSLCISRALLLDSGATLYEGNCTGCHGIGGKGQAGGVPPHGNADFVQQHRYKLMQILLGGYSDSIQVNGLWYNAGMPAFGESFSNREVASILTYIRVGLNDSTVVSCDTTHLDADGFATCVKVKRTPQDLAADSIAVWEVKAVRDSMAAHPAN